MSIRGYADLCGVHHRHLLEEEAGPALVLEKALAESARDLGEHLWYLVDTRDGKSLKIWRPYLGCEGYLRFSYASPRLKYELERLAPHLENLLLLMREELNAEGDDLASTLRSQHEEAIVILSDLAIAVSKGERDPYESVKEWFQELQKLSSPLSTFSDPRTRRILDQECALPLR